MMAPVETLRHVLDWNKAAHDRAEHDAEHNRNPEYRESRKRDADRFSRNCARLILQLREAA